MDEISPHRTLPTNNSYNNVIYIQKRIKANTLFQVVGYMYLSMYSGEEDWPDMSSQQIEPDQGTDISGMNTIAPVGYKAVSMLQNLQMESSKLTN